MKALAKKLGVNYVWGLANFIAGVIGGAFCVGVVTGFFQP